MNKIMHKRTGFTLIEIMVSMAISGMLIAGIYGVYTIQQRTYTVQEQVTEMQQKGRAALDFMVRDIRMAAYNEPDGSCESEGISIASPELLAFETCDKDGNQVVLEYGLYDAFGSNGNGLVDDLYRSKNGGTRQLIAEGVDALEFHYLDEDATSLTTSVTDIGMLNNIRSIQISMLLRASYPDARYTDTIPYQPASGSTNWNSKQTNNNPPGDHYHRRLLITTVKLRNMGL
ncbi:MAG: prepilin-type N-terminal cleavage/methylation domain-containing protein [Candidatus Electrothrix sp. AR4]|nr:prepilin-type N-terminal cleavage/methylation domain-containing protein [Candidatus Electrothrix sp. AR4]